MLKKGSCQTDILILDHYNGYISMQPAFYTLLGSFNYNSIPQKQCK